MGRVWDKVKEFEERSRHTGLAGDPVPPKKRATDLPPPKVVRRKEVRGEQVELPEYDAHNSPAFTRVKGGKTVSKRLSKW